MSGIGCIAAVVLNYKTWEDAVNCVNDLKAQDYPEKHIVVVENGSGNDSAEQLKKRFDNDPLVTVLVSETNLGFAKGNNLGIRYAHEKLGCDTVFVVNSDTRIPASLFSRIAAVDAKGVGAISPYVSDANGVPQNFPVNTDDIDKTARKTIVDLLKANIVSWPLLSKLYDDHVKKGRGEEEHHGVPASAEKPSANKYVLQGCAYFLTPGFFEHYRGIYPRTFLYWEEIDLLLMLKKAGLRSICAEDAELTHFGLVSTQKAAKNINRFRIKHSNRSMMRSLPLILGMSEKRIRRCIDKSEQFTAPLT